MAGSLAALLLLLGGATILSVALGDRTRQRALVHRVDLITRAQMRKLAPLELPSWRGRGLDGLRSLFTFRMRRSWGVSASPVYLAAAGLGAAVAVWMLSLTVVHLPGYASVIGAAGGSFALPRFVLFRQQRRADRQFAELLPDVIDMVVRVVRAGLPIGVAMRTVGQEAKPPHNAVFVKIADQTDIDVPLDQALAETSETVGNPDFRFFAVAVALQQSTGGNLTATHGHHLVANPEIRDPPCPGAARRRGGAAQRRLAEARGAGQSNAGPAHRSDDPVHPAQSVPDHRRAGFSEGIGLDAFAR